MNTLKQFFKFSFVIASLALVACSGPSRPKIAEVNLPQVLQDVQTSWTAQVGPIDFPMVVAAQNNTVALANAQGVVSVLSASTGKAMSRLELKERLSAGVGSDGQQVAVVTLNGDLVVAANGKEQWRSNLNSGSFTPPLVAGGRVFVLTSDRSVLAFDAQTGKKLWQQQRPGDPLVLKNPGVLMPFKNTLLVGLSGRLVGMDPDSGLIRWETAIATPRGTNDVERLVDLVGPADRVGDVVCVRAFQSQVGCVDAQRGQALWTRASVGERGIDGNEKLVIAPLANGVVQVWNRSTGERVWDTERLKYHQLGTPLFTPRGILISDNGGWLYLLSLADGALLNRIKLSGDELVGPPVQAGSTYVVVTRQGAVTGLQIP